MRTLLLIVIQLATILTQQEEQVDLTVVVGQRALFGMQTDTSNGTEHKAPDAPLNVGARDVLMPQTGYNTQIDGCEP